VKSALEDGLDPSGNQGKHTGPEQDRQYQILDSINQNAQGRTPLTSKETKDYRTSQFQVPITRGWINSFILHHRDEIIRVTGSLQEEHRLQVSRVSLEHTVQSLNEYEHV
jgi:hypothetical protein